MSTVSDVGGWAERLPALAPGRSGSARLAIASRVRAFALQSTIASALASLRGLLPTVLVGIVASKSQIANFRVAQAPQTALASLSSPVRLVLLAEQTRDVEHGRGDRAFRLLRRYIATTALLSCVFVPILWFATPWLVRAVYGARYASRGERRARDAARGRGPVRLRLDEVVPGLDRAARGLRTAGQLLELTALVPLVVVLAEAYGATGAAAGILGSSLVLAAFWTISLVRLPLQATMAEETAA